MCYEHVRGTIRKVSRFATSLIPIIKNAFPKQVIEGGLTCHANKNGFRCATKVWVVPFESSSHGESSGYLLYGHPTSQKYFTAAWTQNHGEKQRFAPFFQIKSSSNRHFRHFSNTKIAMLHVCRNKNGLTHRTNFSFGPWHCPNLLDHPRYL